MLRRQLLAILSAVFVFMERFPERWAQPWPTVRRELVAMARAVPLMIADLGAPISNVVFAWGAMGSSLEDDGGFGVVAGDVADGTKLEMFAVGSHLGYTVARLDGDFHGLRNQEKEMSRTIPFTKQPHELFSGAVEWVPVSRGRWRYAEHITIG